MNYNTKIIVYYILIVLLSSIFYFSVFNRLQIYPNAATSKYKFPDSKHYEGAGKAFYTNNFKLSKSRPLGFPILIGVPYLFKASPESHVNFKYILQFLFWLSSVCLLFSLLKNHLHYFLSVFLALLYSINLGNIAITNQSLTEPVFCLLLTLAAFGFDRYLSDKNHSYLMLSFFAICYAAICKPVMEYFAYLMVIYILWSLYKSNVLKFKYITATILIFAFTIGLQKSLMKVQYGSFQISNIGKAALYTYIGAKAKSLEKGIRVHKEMKHRREYRKKFKGAALDSLIMGDFKDQLLNNTSNLIKAYFLNINENSTKGSTFIKSLKNLQQDKDFYPKRNGAYYWSAKQNQLYSLLVIIVLPILLLIGLFLRDIRTVDLYQLALFMWLLSIYIVVFSGLSYGQKDRFHIVFVPIAIATLALLVKLYYNYWFNESGFRERDSMDTII